MPKSPGGAAAPINRSVTNPNYGSGTPSGTAFQLPEIPQFGEHPMISQPAVSKPATMPEASPMPMPTNTEMQTGQIGGGSDNTVNQSPWAAPSINPNQGMPGVTPITNTPSTSNYNAGSFFNMPRASNDIMSMLNQWLPKIMAGLPRGGLMNRGGYGQ